MVTRIERAERRLVRLLCGPTGVSAGELRTIQALARCLTDHPDLPGHDAATLHRATEWLRGFHPGARLEVWAALALIETAPRLLTRRRVAFSAMCEEDAEAWMSYLGSHRLGPVQRVASGLRALVALAYYTGDDAFQAVGYPGPLIARESIGETRQRRSFSGQPGEGT
jgi:hypothetical protein